MRVTGFDHLVLNVTDVERALDFYCGPLGLEPVRVQRGPHLPGSRASGLAGGRQLRILEVIEGPADRYGARGTGQSIYVRDPDGNVIELRWYPQDKDRV